MAVSGFLPIADCNIFTVAPGPQVHVADLPGAALLHFESPRVLPLVVAQIPGVARCDGLHDDVAVFAAVGGSDPQHLETADLVYPGLLGFEIAGSHLGNID